MAAVTETDETPLHSRIATDLLHGRSAVGTPRVSPDGAHVACVVSTIDLDENITRSRVWLDGAPVTAGPHDSQPTWSPDGRWLLVGWPAADQWLFIDVDHPRDVRPFDHISEQFDPGGNGSGRFPRVDDWALPGG